MSNNQTEIPEDVMKAAEEALDNLLCNCKESCGGTYEGVRAASILDIARAIMAERERCLNLCDAERQRRAESNYPAVRRHDFMAVAIKLHKQIKSGEVPPKQEA